MKTKIDYKTCKGFDAIFKYEGKAHVNYFFDPREYDAPEKMKKPGTVICMCSKCRNGWPVNTEYLRAGSLCGDGRHLPYPVCPSCGHSTEGEIFRKWEEHYTVLPWLIGTATDEDERFKILFTAMKVYPVINKNAAFLKMTRVGEKIVMTKQGRSYHILPQGGQGIKDISYEDIPQSITNLFLSGKESERADSFICKEYEKWSGRNVTSLTDGLGSVCITKDNRFKGNVFLANDSRRLTYGAVLAYRKAEEHISEANRNADENEQLPYDKPLNINRRTRKRLGALSTLGPEKLLEKFFPSDFSAPSSVKKLIYKDPPAGYYFMMLYRCGVTNPSVLGNLAINYTAVRAMLCPIDTERIFEIDILADMFGKKTAGYLKEDKTGYVEKLIKTYVLSYGQSSVHELLTKDSSQAFSEVVRIFGTYYQDLKDVIFPEKRSLENIEKFLCTELERLGKENADTDRIAPFVYSEEDRARECIIDGYRFELPETPADLAEYGARMHNCAGTYAKAIRNREYRYSTCRIYKLLRGNVPAACIEISVNETVGKSFLIQAKGISNRILPPDIFPILDKWLIRNDIDITNQYDGEYSVDYMCALCSWFTGIDTGKTYYHAERRQNRTKKRTNEIYE